MPYPRPHTHTHTHTQASGRRSDEPRQGKGDEVDSRAVLGKESPEEKSHQAIREIRENFPV